MKLKTHKSGKKTHNKHHNQNSTNQENKYTHLFKTNFHQNGLFNFSNNNQVK